MNLQLDDFIFLSLGLIFIIVYIYYQRKTYKRIRDIDKILGYFFKKDLKND